MKKGIAIPYIIALILGIAVVGLIGYWFFILGGRIPGEATMSSCQTKVTTWCSEWARTGEFPYERDVNPKDWDEYAPGCEGIGVGEPSESACKNLLGLSGSSDTSSDTGNNEEGRFIPGT